MILVRFYCKVTGCGRLLSTAADPLPAWLTWVRRERVAFNVRKCPRHGATPEGFKRLAVPGRTVSLSFGPQQVPAKVLWRLIDEARRTGRTQRYGV